MSSEADEMLEVVDEKGKVLGLAKRSELHRNPSLIHRVVHVLVFDRKGRLLLQKRSGNKDVAPGKWDTSVGGHVSSGEPVHDAALREMEEEIGITGERVKFLYTYLFTNDHESELVSTFLCLCEGPFHFNRDEIEEIRFWDLREILGNLDRQLFSRHFEREIRNYLGKSQAALSDGENFGDGNL